jgi:acyl-coenzyme A synthetase/AMP-(fatty) acid ligase
MARLPGTRFSNVYGPAEVNQCTFHHLDDPDQVDEPIPIGRPWRGIELAIVDRTGSPVGDGDTGELLVGGDTMMEGYWERPDLTSAAIDVDAAGRRWYRTGDLAYRRPDGAYVFVGRADHQVKVRGHRVELEAVELAIAARTDVDACAVVVDGDRLVAIVQPPMDDGTVRALLSGLRETLPRYAVPATVVGVERMPRTGTGKIDRRAAANAL